MQHPYLLFSRNDVEKYKKKLSADSDALKRYEDAVSKTEELLAQPFVTEEEANGDDSLHANFGLLNHQANTLCGVLGTKYLIDGDERCAERLKQLLLHFISFERWHAVSYAVRKPVHWHSDLCSTATALACATVFDFIYGYLSEEERVNIAEGIARLGVYPALGDWVMPDTRIHALDSMGHNWWAVCISEAATALLALSDCLDEAKCREYFHYTDCALADYFTYSGNRLFNKFGNFDKEGLFYESINYNNFGTGTLLQYLYSSERYHGRNELIRNALPEGLCDAVMSFSYPVTRDGKTRYNFINFGDSGVDADVSNLAKYALRLGIATPAMKAYVSACDTSLREEIEGFSTDIPGGSVSGLPLTKTFSSGFAVARSSWANDATLFSVKSGFCWNHSHNDSGSFVIFHKGRPFFTDSGTCVYSHKKYHDYYCQDHAHSVLKIGGEGRRDEELYRGTKFPGCISDSFTGKGIFFAQADATGSMAHLCSRMFRNFIWINDRILVIFDDIYCHKENTAQFTLHFDAGYETDGNTVTFGNGDLHAKLTSFYPENVKIAEKTGHDDHKQDEDKPFIELSFDEKQRTHLLINIIELDDNENSVTYERLSSENAEGIRITDGDIIRDIWFNRMADGHVMHDNSNNIIAGFDTDAYMLVITKDKAEKTEKTLVVCGSFLRRGGKALFSTFIKTTKEIITSEDLS